MVLVVPAVFGEEAEPTMPGVPEEATVKLLLLRQKSVQKELELSPETIKKITTFTDAEAEAAGKALKQGEAARKEVFTKLRKDNLKFLVDTLTPKQSKRLDQITMQFAALHHLAKPAIAKSLNLSDEQKQKFKALQHEVHKVVMDIHETKEHKGKHEKLAKLRAETRTKILALLTDDQKAKVREMAGPPFEGEIVFEEPE
jgi:hypothetical protein